MKFTKNEKKLIEMYKDLPNVGMHGRSFKYSEDERMMNPDSHVVYYFILNDEARKQDPSEFISRFRRTVSCNFCYALNDLTQNEIENLQNGKIEIENLPTLTYFTDSFSDKFILNTEKTGISFGGAYYDNSERSPIFDEGAGYLGVPSGAVISKVTFEESESSQLKEDYINSIKGVVSYGGYGALPIIEKRFYEKSLETLINSFE